ncbi:MAG TPA: hypothetical protein VGH27_23575 [Streptosporangiaceae bacterium]
MNPYIYSIAARQHMAFLRREGQAGVRAAGLRSPIRTRTGSTLINLGQRLLDDSAQH